ncbi:MULTISPECIES: four helix bundle protein [unclassified Roseivirga]|uniref:four helix bundle protein n=1 Tax=unclassified Roseivirga TaxID=2626142 RepID=UPI00257E9D3E|nr:MULTISPECIES: four helix bundle protein [unclassified Roseivirga]MEC7755888.1 four helix bundle protein [Bacteroidota bacterium]|tara:strand:- start:195 stop:566 length:372 start_codon:yes stop_codon:yes gene_type:complete
MRTFKELEVWKQTRELRKEIAQLVKRFPTDEKYKLTDQMIRAARSVTANIAEGYGRFHYQENIQFCRISRGSLTELQDHLTVAVDEGYIDESEEKLFDIRIEECIRILNGYINYLLKSKLTKP